ncbi:MAG: M23 family metallopeptidase [Bacteroidetes bacterium]|nr:M23 family metallopeptidase [Bacteroidota bacterium]
MEPKEKTKLITRLKYKYRLVIMAETTFEEKLAISLTPMNVFILFSTTLVIFAAIVISLIVFTPIREYIPGYSDRKTARNVEKLLYKTEKMEKELQQKDRYIKTLQDIFNGKTISPDSLRNLTDSAVGAIDKLINDKLNVLEKREELDNQDQKTANNPSNYMFLPPVKGFVTNEFNSGYEHFAVDVTAKTDEAVKATLDGTVIFASWTPETGHVIGLQHANNLVSIYKHNSVILKKTGTYVNAGDAIAIVGNSGEFTSGPHLHFELWHNGTAINPKDFMVF